jgi:hypothetical protein
MKSKVFAFVALLPTVLALNAQTPIDLPELEQKAQNAAYSMLHGKTLEEREKSQAELKTALEAIFKDPEAFGYEFSVLQSVSVLQPRDKAFRLFTWQLFVDDKTYRYGGYIFLSKGKFIELKDAAKQTRNPENAVLGPDRWYGALYYDILPFQQNGKTAYALLGYNAHSFFSRMKVFDVLTFGLNDKPSFGAPVIEVQLATGRTTKVKRFLMKYAAAASARLHWDPDYQMIVFDHLIFGEDCPEGPLNFPDGSQCAFKYHKGIWNFVEKLVEYTPLDEAPRPKPKDEKEGLFGPK